MSRLGDEFRRLLVGRMMSGKLRATPMQDAIHPVTRLNVTAARILDEDLAAREIRVYVAKVDYEAMTVTLEFQLLNQDGKLIHSIGDATVQQGCTITAAKMHCGLWIDVT